MNNPHNPLGWPVWKRAVRLGLIWALLFFAAAGILYVLAGMFGWDTTPRAVCAGVAGPLLASALIILWWLVRRPALSEARPVQGEADDKPDGHGDASAV